MQLLNSTPLGQVIDDRRLREFRAMAGHRIGDGQTIDLLRFIAWMAIRRHLEQSDSEESEPDGEGEAYSRKKERERERNAAASRTGRDIAPLPVVKDPERRAKA